MDAVGAAGMTAEAEAVVRVVSVGMTERVVRVDGAVKADIVASAGVMVEAEISAGNRCSQIRMCTRQIASLARRRHRPHLASLAPKWSHRLWLTPMPSTC